MPANDTQISSTDTPAVSRTAPSQSIETSSLRSVGSRSVRCSRNNAITASGTHTKKHQRQPSGLSTITPPRIGPPDIETAITAPIRPE
ncbi:Uncharacterised protein [Mycobacteroides abscessus subsp. abscessus]|nr:Uncharacterised protein [Mycobacteroides abscessus subsp. abscessus]